MIVNDILVQVVMIDAPLQSECMGSNPAGAAPEA